jgi:purine-binding chemotaxis protein CheW
VDGVSLTEVGPDGVLKTRRRVATFWVGPLWLGIEIGDLQEVLRDQETTPVPLADPAILGLLNLRGRLSAVIGARRRFGLPDPEPGAAEAHFIVRTATGPVSLVVDGEDEVVEAVPETVSTRIRELVTGAYQLERGLLLLLDAQRTITFDAEPVTEVARAGPGD